MKAIIFWIVLAYIVWVFWGRALYIISKHKKMTGKTTIPNTISTEGLYNILQKNLNYPDLKSVYYNEKGDVSIAARYGEHTLTLADGALTIEPSYQDKLNKRMRACEEADCLYAYITKLFDTAAPVNPYELYKKMRNARRNGILVASILVALFAVYSFVTVAPVLDSSNIVTQSCLTSYSTTTTIGEAFEGFFSNPKWTSYKQGAQKFVDFQGGCTYGDQDVNVLITFAIYDDSFNIVSAKMNGEEMPDIFLYELLEVVYAQVP